MLRAVVYAVLGIAVACALPVEQKTACFTSADCVDDRVCDEGQCRPGGCEATCVRACDRIEECDETAMCNQVDCNVAAGMLPGFGGNDCKAQWDLLPEEDCDAVDCMLDCRDLCQYAAEECSLVVDVPACTVGCQTLSDCSTPLPGDCVDVPADIRCYESGDC